MSKREKWIKSKARAIKEEYLANYTKDQIINALACEDIVEMAIRSGLENVGKIKDDVYSTADNLREIYIMANDEVISNIYYGVGDNEPSKQLAEKAAQAIIDVLEQGGE